MTRVIVATLLVAVSTMTPGSASATSCGSGTYPFPYTDVAGVGDAFCPGIMEAYVLGVTRGTTATTFTPNQDVTRLQMTTFLQRSIDQVLRRTNRRAALGQWWTPKTVAGLQAITLPGPGPASLCRSDGERVWVTNGDRAISVQSSNGQLRVDHDVTGGSALFGVVAANGNVYISDPFGVNAKLWAFKASLEAPFSSAFGRLTAYNPGSLAFDGNRLWTANYSQGSIAIVPIDSDQVPEPAGASIVGGFNAPNDLLFDGVDMWVTDQVANVLRRLNANGTVAQSIPVGIDPGFMTFDGANIWVPNYDGSITVVQASTGTVVATITSNAANRLSSSQSAAFDGERILVTNSGNDSVTLFRAADLSLIGNVQLPAGSVPVGACSDGINFWVTLRGTKQLLRI